LVNDRGQLIALGEWPSASDRAGGGGRIKSALGRMLPLEALEMLEEDWTLSVNVQI
jgi:hypothetical protein